MDITTKDQLRALYGFAKGRSTEKQLTELEPQSRNFIAHSNFVVISTYDLQGGVDVSPKGGAAGFVKYLNNKEIIIPDAKGNNRLDGLINIIETGRIGTLFLIPGVDETLRINGSATITTEEAILAMFDDEKNPPKSCTVIHIEEVFLHCAKAFMRSKLWSVDAQIKRSSFPTMGQMLNDQLKILEKPETLEQMQTRYQADL